MADGIFTIRPKRRSAITCTLGESTTVKYYVPQVRINWNEQDRVKVAYASGGHGGFASGEQRGLSQATFEMVIFGTDLADAMSGLRTVTQALTSRYGGYIQYRPRGLSSSVMSTYYHYLQSGPPAIDGQGPLSEFGPNYLQGGRTHTYAIRCQCQVMIKAWATSDPQSPQTIVSETTGLDNGLYDGTHTPHIVALSSNIKGDAVFPAIFLYGNAVTDRAYIHKRSMEAGSSSFLDWLEAEDADTQTNFANTVNASASGGEVERTSSASAVLEWVSPGFSDNYLGHVSMVMVYNLAAGTSYTVVATLENGTGTLDQSETVTISGHANWQIAKFSELLFPPWKVTEWYDDSTTPPIAYVAGSNVKFKLEFTRVSGSGNLDVDYAIATMTDEWFGFVEKSVDTAGAIVIDALQNAVWLHSSESITTAYVVENWSFEGDSLSNLILHKGFDYCLRFMFADSSDHISIGDTFSAKVLGIYATIFPFEES